jgi:hypothetical protein
MFKVLLLIFVLTVAAIAAGTYFQFNAVYLILLILGFGLYMTTRIGGPFLPQGSMTSWSGPGQGPYFKVYFSKKPDDSCGGEDPKEGDGFR